MTKQTVEQSNTNSVCALSSAKEMKEYVNQTIPKIMEKAHFFRRDSQHSLSFQTLTMLCGQHPHRILRQITAEVDSRRSALLESYTSMKKITKKILDTEDDIECQLLEYQKIELENLVQNTIKDITVLSERYEQIETNNGIDNWGEEEFERAEAAFHVRRGFELLYQNLIQTGRPEKSIIEYLQQHGIHPQIATREVLGYITLVEQELSENKCPTASHLEDFLDEMMKKYEAAPVEVSQRIFGTSELVLTKSIVPTIEQTNTELNLFLENTDSQIGRKS